MSEKQFSTILRKVNWVSLTRVDYYERLWFKRRVENKQNEDPYATDKQINIIQKGFNKPNNEDISEVGCMKTLDQQSP